VETSIEIQAPASAAWELLTDTRRWSQWGPSVIAAGCDGHLIGPGSVGWVQTIVGMRLPFRITEFEAGRRWSWEVAGIPATGHRVEALGPGRCRVVFEVPLLAAPYLAVCRLAGMRIRRILGEETRGG
jgi:hypothetical protein